MNKFVKEKNNYLPFILYPTFSNAMIIYPSFYIQLLIYVSVVKRKIESAC